MSDIKSRPAIGVIFHPSFPPETLAEYAQRAEAAGFDELWLWDDCFMPGAFTSAGIALSATQHLKVGIGLLPVPAYHPLFAAMEITTLARAFPGRILPGFGQGVAAWMAQIGAVSRSPLNGLDETVRAVRHLLGGEDVTIHGESVNLEHARMQLTPGYVPPLYIGAMREKSLQLAGRVGDGTILCEMSSPAYVRWALGQIRAGMVDAGRVHHRVVVYLYAKVNPDREAARAAIRQAMASRLPWADVHLDKSGFAADVEKYFQTHDRDDAAKKMPDEWVDALSAAGTPDQVAEAVQRLIDAGADSVVLQPLNGDPACLDEYIRYLTPLGKLTG
jgi:5,10-methylenetetrahydromethanopterin reductase